MEYYIGIDVSLELSSLCVVDGSGVTTINPSLRACAPICISCGPQGVPARSNSRGPARKGRPPCRQRAARSSAPEPRNRAFAPFGFDH